MMNKSREYRRL